MKLEVYKHRSRLKRTMEAIRKGNLTIGFIGGSITDARGRNRWPEPVAAWFVDSFPGVRIIIENAAIGATGSDLAVFRAERDLLERNCDLIFVEYAVNDNEEPTEKRMRTREGLLRKLLKSGRSDVVLTYTFSMDMYEAMIKDEMPPSIEEFERLAEHYGLGSVWMGLYALEQVRRGLMRWEEWLPDGLHPDLRGSYSYGQSVIGFLEDELLRDTARGKVEGKTEVEGTVKDRTWVEKITEDKQEIREHEPAIKEYKLPASINNRNWEKAYILPFENIELRGPWTIRRCTTFQWMDQVIDTSAVGAELGFSFNGRGLILGFDFGRASAEFAYKLDGGPWVEIKRDRPAWCGDEGWYRVTYICDDLPPQQHRFELKVIHGNREECKGTNFRLALVGILP